jgi:hypothetical protein
MAENTGKIAEGENKEIIPEKIEKTEKISVTKKEKLAPLEEKVEISPEEIKKEISAEIPTREEIEPSKIQEINQGQVLSEAKSKILEIEKQDASKGNVAQEAKQILDEERKKYLKLAE